MAKSSDTKAKIIEILADMPFVNQACRKAGVSRATYYRWMKENMDFREKVNRALESGRENIGEIGEVMLLKKMREGELGAIKYYLSNNSERYAPRRPRLPAPAISNEEKEMYVRVYDFMKSNKPIPKEQWLEIQTAMKRAGFMDEDGQPTRLYEEKFGQIVRDIIEESKEKFGIDWYSDKKAK